MRGINNNNSVRSVQVQSLDSIQKIDIILKSILSELENHRHFEKNQIIQNICNGIRQFLLVITSSNKSDKVFDPGYCITWLEYFLYQLEEYFGKIFFLTQHKVKLNNFIEAMREREIKSNFSVVGSSSVTLNTDVKKVEIRRQEQIVLSKNHDFQRILSKIKQLALEGKFQSKRIFISYAWPDSKIDVDESWAQQFVSGLREDLNSAGFKTYQDLQQSCVGIELHRFMKEQISEADHVLVICNQTMARKFSSGLTGVMFEYLAYIDMYKTQKDSDSRYIVPICLTNDAKDIPGLVGIFAATSVYTDGYANALLQLITKLYGFKEYQLKKLFETEQKSIANLENFGCKFFSNFNQKIDHNLFELQQNEVRNTNNQFLQIGPMHKENSDKRAREVFKRVLKERYTNVPAMKNIQLFGQGSSVLKLSECFINLALIEKNDQEQRKGNEEKFSFRDEQLSCQEPIHKPKSLINLSQLFETRDDQLSTGNNSCDKSRNMSDLPKLVETKHILVEGKAGIGKSTLSRYLAHVWANDQLAEKKLGDWAKKFTAVIYIPLQILKQDQYKKNYSSEEHLYALERLIIDVLDIEKALVEEFKVRDVEKHLFGILSSLKKQKSVLYILDGLDEVANLISEVKKIWPNKQKRTLACQLLDELLNQPYWILTSRPNRGGELLAKEYDSNCRYLENVGLIKENLRPYINLHMQDKDVQLVDPLIWHLESNRNLRGIAYVPINLSIICMAWQEESSRNDLHQNPTLTKIYSILRTLLMRRFLIERVEQKCESSENNLDSDCEFEDELTERDEKSYSKFFKIEKGSPTALLEALAWQMQQDDVLTFKPSEEKYRSIIETYLTKEKKHLWAKHEVHLGLLNGIDNMSWVYQQQRFVHLTFQEYLSALHVVNQFKKAGIISFKGRKLTFAGLVAELKYDRRFEVFWWFVAGLLKDETVLLGKFFEALQSPPLSFIPIYDYQLHFRCLEESESCNILPERLIRKDEIHYWINVLLDNNVCQEQSRKLWFYSALVECPNTMRYLKITSYFIDDILFDRIGRELGQGEVIQVIQSLRKLAKFHWLIPRVLIKEMIFEYALKILSMKKENLLAQQNTVNLISMFSDIPKAVLLKIVSIFNNTRNDKWLRETVLKILENQERLDDDVYIEILKLLEHGDSDKKYEILRVVEKHGVNCKDTVKPILDLIERDEGILRDILRKILAKFYENGVIDSNVIHKLLLSKKSNIVRSALLVLDKQKSIPDDCIEEVIRIHVFHNKEYNYMSSSMLNKHFMLSKDKADKQIYFNAVILIFNDSQKEIIKNNIQHLKKFESIPEAVESVLIENWQSLISQIPTPLFGILSQYKVLSENILECAKEIVLNGYEDVQKPALRLIIKNMSVNIIIQLITNLLNKNDWQLLQFVFEKLEMHETVPATMVEQLSEIQSLPSTTSLVYIAILKFFYKLRIIEDVRWEEYLDDKNPQVVLIVLNMLEKQETISPETIGKVFKLAQTSENSNITIQEAAIKMLGKHLTQNISFILPKLIMLLSDPYEGVQIICIDELEKHMRKVNIIPEQIFKLLDSRDHRVMVFVLKLLSAYSPLPALVFERVLRIWEASLGYNNSKPENRVLSGDIPFASSVLSRELNKLRQEFNYSKIGNRVLSQHIPFEISTLSRVINTINQENFLDLAKLGSREAIELLHRHSLLNLLKGWNNFTEKTKLNLSIYCLYRFFVNGNSFVVVENCIRIFGVQGEKNLEVNEVLYEWLSQLIKLLPDTKNPGSKFFNNNLKYFNTILPACEKKYQSSDNINLSQRYGFFEEVSNNQDHDHNNFMTFQEKINKNN